MTGLAATHRRRFVAGPVDPGDLVGRETQVRDLLKRALGAGAPLLHVVGPRLIGRTSFLNFVRDLARCHGSGTHYASMFAGVERVIVPVLDFGQRDESSSIGVAIARAIDREMREPCFDLGTPSFSPESGPAPLDAVAHALRELGDGTRILLLVDRAERLLLGESTLAHQRWEGDAVRALGTLNDAVPSLRIGLAFGVGEPVREVDAEGREQRERALVQLISSLLRLYVVRIPLGFLEAEEIAAFARDAGLRPPDEPFMPFDKHEIEWLVDLCGGHPFVMHRAGLIAYDQGALNGRRPTTEEVEAELLASLESFLGDARARLSGTPDAETHLRRVAAGAGDTSMPAEIAHLLAGEGLVEVVKASRSGSAVTRMPSRALREAVCGTAPPELTRSPGRGQQPAFKLTYRGGDTMSVTSSEHALLQALLGAEPGTVVSRMALAEAIDGTDEHQVTQRLSVLRKKIDRAFGVSAAIENVYGHGYRLLHPEVFTLR